MFMMVNNVKLFYNHKGFVLMVEDTKFIRHNIRTEFKNLSFYSFRSKGSL
jgi:hypothetical protein